MPSITFSEGTTPRVKDTLWRIRAKQIIQARTNMGDTAAQTAASAKDTRWAQMEKLNEIFTLTP